MKIVQKVNTEYTDIHPCTWYLKYLDMRYLQFTVAGSRADGTCDPCDPDVSEVSNVLSSMSIKREISTHVHTF